MIGTHTVGGQARYELEWGSEFWAAIRAAIDDGARTVLDVGGGRRPSLDPSQRAGLETYVGLDVSARELHVAPPGSYDEMVAADIQTVVPALEGRFDLLVAWQVLEHVSDLALAAEVLRRYAADGGTLVACLSGRNAVYAVGNRLLPDAIGSRLVAGLRRRPRETVFPAHYDHCDATGLRVAFRGWDDLSIVPLWRGADYFERFPPLRRAYIAYEDWAIRRGRANLATHYTVVARHRPASAQRPTTLR